MTGADEPGPPSVPAVGRASVVRNATVLTAATMAARLSAFALAIVLARVLGTEEYGRYGLAIAVGTIVAPLADFGLTPFLAREVARSGERGDALLGGLLRIKIGLVAAAGTLTVLLAWLVLEDRALAVAVVVVVAAALADSTSQLVFGYFQGRETMGFEARLTAATSFVRSAGGIVVAVATEDLIAVVAFLLSVSALQLVVAMSRLRRIARPAGTRPAIPWRDVAAIGAMVLFVMVYLRADTVLVGWLVDESAAGLYTAAYTIVMGLQIAPWMIATALTPVLARTNVTDRAAYAAAWQEGLRAVLLVALPLALATSLLATPLLDLLFGDDFRVAGTALAVLCAACPLAALNVVTSGALRAAGHERWLLVTSAAGAVLNVGVNVFVIPRHGIEGAAVVTIATELLVLAAQAAYTVRRGLAPAPRLPLGGIGLSLAALAGVVLLLDDLIVPVPFAAGVVAFAGVAVATGAVRRAEVDAVRRRLLRRA